MLKGQKRKEKLIQCIQCHLVFSIQNWWRHLRRHDAIEKNPKIPKPRRGVASTEEKEVKRRKRISETMKKNPNSGGLRVGSGRGKKQWYDSHIAGNVYLRSTYELEYAKWLDRNNIRWKQNLIKFPFNWEDSIRYYYPDFYLIDDDLFVEIKGYETEKDKAKWKDFPFKLKVLYKKDLLEMGLPIPKY